jgi:hypothetical protein
MLGRFHLGFIFSARVSLATEYSPSRLYIVHNLAIANIVLCERILLSQIEAKNV